MRERESLVVGRSRTKMRTKSTKGGEVIEEEVGRLRDDISILYVVDGLIVSDEEIVLDGAYKTDRPRNLSPVRFRLGTSTRAEKCGSSKFQLKCSKNHAERVENFKRIARKR